jgi:response regulator RpfG family c-di-GMP phosphodiesterase
LQQQQLERDKQRLEELTHKQNLELRDLNANLEEKVKDRTRQVREAMSALELAHGNLKKSFITSIRVFANLIELRKPALAGHSRRVADLARSLARHLGMSEAEIQDIFIAALLLDIGKIGLPDNVLEKPFSGLNKNERLELIKHPIKGQTALMALEQLQGAATLIRSHNERFDGMGFPDMLKGQEIPLGSRMLALVNDYDAVQIGLILPSHLSQTEALAYLQKWQGSRYDPFVVEAFLSMMGAQKKVSQSKAELALHSRQLKTGMVIARDLLGQNGELLLAKDSVLNEHLVEQIMSFERTGGDTLTVHIVVK